MLAACPDRRLLYRPGRAVAAGQHQAVCAVVFAGVWGVACLQQGVRVAQLAGVLPWARYWFFDETQIVLKVQ